MNTVYTVLTALLAAIIGGWAGSFFQFQKWKRSEKASFMWEFRIKIFEAEKLMWEAKTYVELMGTINWLMAAITDPRINLDNKYVEDYSSALENAWRDLKKREVFEEEFLGISTTLLDEVRKTRNELDKNILKKVKKLSIG